MGGSERRRLHNNERLFHVDAWKTNNFQKNERTKVAWKTFFWDSMKDLGNCCTIQKGLIHSTFFITRCTHYSHTLPNYVDSICQKENEAVTFCVRQLFVSLFLKFVIHQNHSEKNDPNVWGRLYKAAYH